MQVTRKQKLAAATIAALALAGGGGALAASKLTASSETQAVVNDAAKQLGVTPTALSNALKKALENRVDAAVSAGRLTQAQGNALKARIEANTLPPLFFDGRGRGDADGDRGFGHHGGFHDDLAAAASYLGISESKLETELSGGKTLAKIAGENGKSVDGLIQALVAAKTKELDADVAAGRLTKAEEQQILSSLKQHVTDLVNGVRPTFSHDGPPTGGPVFRPPGL